MRKLALAIGCLGLLTAAPALAEEKLRHVIDLVLEPADGRLDVVDRIDVSGKGHLAIKPVQGLTISGIKVDGEPATAERDDGVTWIELPSEGGHQVEITYGGVLEQSGSGRSLSPVIAADGVFLPYGIGWLANGGAEDDRVTYRLTIDVPAPYKAAATGALVEEEEADGRYRATFSSTTPTEPPSVFAGDYRIDERQHGDLRLRTYFPAERQDLAPAYLDQVAGYIDRFETLIGDYPYDGFSVIASPLPVGLGFPGATYVSSQILHMPFMLTRSLAHEILHNWWANGVFVDYAEGNWAEGFTTYMADYGLAENDGAENDGAKNDGAETAGAGARNDDAAWQMRLGWLRDFAALPPERDKPINEFRSKGHDADQVIGYNKVAMVLHMLKQDLGDDAFSAGLRDFWETHKFETAGWSDLQASFEAASGRALDRFFDPWLGQKGAPSLALTSATLKEQDGGYQLDIEISSDQPGYELLVPVQIELPSRVERRSLRLTDGIANETFDFLERPLSVGVDQRHDLFRRLAEGEAPPILRDVTLSAETLAIVATNGSGNAANVAKELAARTLDTGFRIASADDDAISNAPLMLIGMTDEIQPVLAEAGIDAVPTSLQDQGTARSWISPRKDAPPVLVVAADDEEALQALLRPLPHYGRQSFLVFDGRKVIKKGVWPAGENALTKRFD